jgi:excinuclease ABC subunit C
MIQDILKNLPDQSGIYLFYSSKKELIYVGKATSLKSRVSSYFRGVRSSRPIEQMMHEVTDIKWKTTDSALEAAILESVYIKKYLPRYNVDGKDDKSWNYIVITNEAYPQVKTFRQREMEVVVKGKEKREKSKTDNDFLHVFGPYPGLNSAAAMKVLRRMFLFSNCQKPFKHSKPGKPLKPCLYRQMGQCLGVCTGDITSKEYRAKVIRPLAIFLSGKKKQVITDFEKQMKRAAKQEDFETAARLRDQLKQLERIQDIAMINSSFTTERKEVSKGVSRIEGYDISNLGNTGKVGSMVVFVDGYPDKKEYRKFTIKTVEGQSDVDCLEEVIRRRLKHDEWVMPDIFLIDGGLPQVNKVQSIFDELGILTPVVGIAKGPQRKRNDFVFPKSNKTVMLWVKQNEDVLVRVRDEAHRFAITFQRSKRKI